WADRIRLLVRTSGVMWMSSRTPASMPRAPSLGAKKRSAILFVVPVVCAGERAPAAPVGVVGKAPGAPGAPVVRGSPGRPPGAVVAPPGRVVVVVGETIPCEIDCTINVAK